MKVLVVHNRYRSSSPSGEDRVVDQETAALEAEGCEVRRFERSSDEIADLSLIQKAAIPARVAWNRGAARSLIESIDAFGPDVVHVHNIYPLLSPSVLQAVDGRVPAVVTFHNYRPLCPTGQLFRSGANCVECVGRLPLGAVKHGCYQGSSLSSAPMALATLVQRRLWRRVPSAYIFLSDAQRQLFDPLELPTERCFVKSNLVHRSSNVEQSEPIVAFVGRLDEAKGIQLLMDAWDRFRISSGRSTLRLVIAGSGALEPLVSSWAARDPSVDLLGLLSREDCGSLMARARAVVVPSIWEEPFGMVVVEAMAQGTAPIAPAHGAFPELIRDGVDGALFASHDAVALSTLIARVDDEPEWCDALGRAARSTHASRFAPETNIAQLLSIYRFAIDHRVAANVTHGDRLTMAVA